MKLFFVGFALLLLPALSKANDSSFEGVGGSARPTKGENKAIRMVRETVVLTARANDYSTRAYFVFSNETSRAQTVTMGFPEGNFGDVGSAGPLPKTGFRGFKTFVDGRPLLARRTFLREMDDGGFDTYWVKTVSFAPRQTRRVRVEFSSPYGGTTNWGLTNALSYAFTGKNWRGNVAQSVLEVRLTQPGLWRVVALGDDQKILPFQQSSAAKGITFRRVWKNWDAQEGVIIGLERATPFWRKDTHGPDSGAFTMSLVKGTRTVRVGPKPTVAEAEQGFPTQGFTRDGTFYVGVNYLEDKFVEWGAQQKPKFEPQLSFAPSSGFDLRAGKTRIQGKEGERRLFVNGREVATSAPLLTIRSGSARYLYVPLSPLAKALGWKFALNGERLFVLERGN